MVNEYRSAGVQLRRARETFLKRCKGLGHLLRTDSEAALAAHLPQFADDEILMLDFPLRHADPESE